MIRRLCPWFLLLFAPLYCCILLAQIQVLGTIGGQLRIAGGDTPSRQMMVELRLHGATINSVYTDAEGHFNFNNLEGNPYRVVINDEAYYPVEEVVNLRPEIRPNVYLQISLRPREQAIKSDPIGARASGANPYLVDPADYNKRFPKRVIQEYQRAIEAERKGKRDEAIPHYLAALKVAPDYYPAHNNLGAIYLGKTDFQSAEEQFREAIRLNPNDAQAYFNLGNVLLLTRHYPESQDAIRSGLERDPNSAFGYFLNGSLAERTGNYPEAEKNLQQALRLNSRMWQAQLQLVNAYIQQGRQEDAISQLQNFLKAFPEAPAVPHAKELLGKLQNSASTGKH
jgi:tetratricopeptide (TPR) repeat protein